MYVRIMGRVVRVFLTPVVVRMGLSMVTRNARATMNRHSAAFSRGVADRHRVRRVMVGVMGTVMPKTPARLGCIIIAARIVRALLLRVAPIRQVAAVRIRQIIARRVALIMEAHKRGAKTHVPPERGATVVIRHLRVRVPHSIAIANRTVRIMAARIRRVSGSAMIQLRRPVSSIATRVRRAAVMKMKLIRKRGGRVV